MDGLGLSEDLAALDVLTLYAAEQDTCVVSILDHRASKKGRYRGDVLDALPKCQMVERIEEVEDFIRSRKVERYYS